MPKEARYVADLVHAIRDNNLHDVKFIFETKLKRSETNIRVPFLCATTDTADAISKGGKDFENAVMAATRADDAAILRYMTGHGVNINFLFDSPLNDNKTIKTTPLHVAVFKGNHEAVDILLESNADISLLDSKGQSALHVAVKKADCASARMLLCRGANIHAVDSKGSTALQIASKYGHVELVRILLEHNAQVFHKSQKGPSPLHMAAMEGHVPLIDIFSRYVDVNIKMPCNVGNKEKACIHLAAERGLIETVRFLIERFGADVNVLDSDSQTPLHCVALHRHDHKRMRRKEDFDLMADLFIKKGVKVNQQNTLGNTALHLAAKNHYHRVVEFLLLSNSDPNIKNKKGKTAKDMIPEFDMPMKQLFLRYSALFSSYPNQSFSEGTVHSNRSMTEGSPFLNRALPEGRISHPCSPALTVRSMKPDDISIITEGVRKTIIDMGCGTSPSAPQVQ